MLWPRIHRACRRYHRRRRRRCPLLACSSATTWSCNTAGPTLWLFHPLGAEPERGSLCLAVESGGDLCWKAGKIVSTEIHAKSGGAFRRIPPQGQAVARIRPLAGELVSVENDGAIRVKKEMSYAVEFRRIVNNSVQLKELAGLKPEAAHRSARRSLGQLAQVNKRRDSNA